MLEIRKKCLFTRATQSYLSYVTAEFPLQKPTCQVLWKISVAIHCRSDLHVNNIKKSWAHHSRVQRYPGKLTTLLIQAERGLSVINISLETWNLVTLGITVKVYKQEHHDFIFNLFLLFVIDMFSLCFCRALRVNWKASVIKNVEI